MDKPSTSTATTPSGEPVPLSPVDAPHHHAHPTTVRRSKQKNRPVDSDWRQQRLAGFRPVINAECALPITSILCAITIALGVLLFMKTNDSLEIVTDYTDCFTDGTHQIASKALNASDLTAQQLTCTYNIVLEKNFTNDVTFYYGLNGFYQNTRLYTQSRSELQLFGKLQETDGCNDPVLTDIDPADNVKKIIAPCGYVADSMFNDTFTLTDANGLVPFSATNVVDNSTLWRQFRNPPQLPGQSFCDSFNGTVKPKSWRKPICALGAGDDVGMGLQNIDFVVWMKPAALPRFRKKYRTLDKEAYQYGLLAGNYTLKIKYNYPVQGWNGRKFFIITSEKWDGGRNFFLAIAYLVVGAILLVLSIIFLLLMLRIKYLRSKTLQD